jgi:hypothetical protein
VTNNNGFWTGWLDLLALLLLLYPIITAHNQSSAETFFLECRGLSPFCFSFYDWLQTTFVAPINLRHGPRTENTLRIAYPRKTCLRRSATNILYCWPEVFIDTLPSNGRPIVVTRLSGKVFTGPLPSNGYVSQYFFNGGLVSHCCEEWNWKANCSKADTDNIQLFHAIVKRKWGYSSFLASWTVVVVVLVVSPALLSLFFSMQIKVSSEFWRIL